MHFVVFYIFRPPVSVFQMVMNNFKRSDFSDSIESHRNELCKGAWEEDMRHALGICIYEDGSKFVGQWKENRRHGYRLYVDHVGEKSGY